MEIKVNEAFECRLCGEIYAGVDEAMVCCNPVRYAYICGECDERFNSQDEVTAHVHIHRLQAGDSTLGEWETAIQVDQQL